MEQPLIPPQCIYGDVNEATPDSAHSNRHPSNRMDVSSIPATSEPSNLTPPPTVTKSKGAEPPTGEEDVTSSSCPWQRKKKLPVPCITSSSCPSLATKGKFEAGQGQGQGRGRASRAVKNTKKYKTVAEGYMHPRGTSQWPSAMGTHSSSI